MIDTSPDTGPVRDSARRRGRLPVPALTVAGLASLCILLAILAILLPGPARQVSIGLADTLAPALGLVSGFSTQLGRAVQSAHALLDAEGLAAELETEAARARHWQTRAVELEIENAELRRQLSMPPADRHRFLTARIIGGPTGPFRRSMLINAGREDGVVDGSTVTLGPSLFGRVIGAGRQTSRVLLLTDSNSRVPVLVGPDRVRAILSGDGTATPVLEYTVPPGNLPPTARVVTSGTGGVYLPDIPVGELDPARGRVRLDAGPRPPDRLLRILLPTTAEPVPQPGLIRSGAPAGSAARPPVVFDPTAPVQGPATALMRVPAPRNLPGTPP